MEYINLRKIYYENQKNTQVWENEYKQRFNNPSSEHLGIFIKEINRKNEYEAFFCYTKEIINLQEKIFTEFLKLKELINIIPGAGINQFLYSCLIDEIKSSNDIENVKSTRREIKEAVLQQEKPNSKVRLWGIVNKYIKIIHKENIPLKTCEDVRTLYDDFILDEIIREDKEDRPDGILFRKESVDVGANFQKPIHKGIYPESKIIEYMDKALKLLRDSNIPRLIRIAVFHYLFGYIHPFYDGNGRMSRFITSYYLSKYLNAVVALRLSLLIKKHRTQYYKMFEITTSEYNKGDLTPFIIWSLEFILLAVKDTKIILSCKYNEYISLKEKLSNLSIYDNTSIRIYNILLQATIFSDIGATIKEIAATTNKSEKTIGIKLRNIPKDHIIIDDSSRPYHYKLNMNIL